MTRDLDLDALARLALAVAQDATQLVMEGYRAHPETTTKAHAADLVTDYDRRCEQAVRAALTEATGFPVVGEEGGGELTAAATWVIDPIDGTTNFAHGHPFFAVSVGLLVDFTPRVGAVVAPALGNAYVGTPTGARRNGEPITVSGRDELGQALLATGFAPNQDAAHERRNLAMFTELLPRTRGIRRDGSAALDICLTAEGTFDGYWEHGLHVWDVAGAAAIALGAGATITDLTGQAPDYRIGHLAVSNGRLHRQLLEALAGATRDKGAG